MLKQTLAILLIISVLSRNYPLYHQCDGQWGGDQLGTSRQTICQAGCLMSSAAMALTGTGHSYNPRTLNTWLKANGGYVSGDLFVWASINKLGLTFKGFISNSAIKQNLDAENVVIVNVHNGGHWVLAHGHSGDNIMVNDPGFSTASYALSAIVDGHTGLYTVNRLPDYLNNWVYTIQISLYNIVGYKQQLITSAIPQQDDQKMQIRQQ